MKTPPPDKVLHFAAGTIAAAAGVAVAVLFAMLGLMVWPAGAAVLSCAAAALAREAYNRRQGGVFDWRDIGATLAGGVAPVICFVLGATQ